MTDSASERKAIESIRESGAHGGIGNIPDQEDADLMVDQGNIPYPKDGWRLSYEPRQRGSVEVNNETDDLFNNPQSAPVDLFLDAKDFLREKYGRQYDGNKELFVEDVDSETVKKEYEKWKAKEGEVEVEEKQENLVTLDRSDIPEYLPSTKYSNIDRANNALNLKSKKGVSVEAELPNPVAEYWEELKDIWKDPNAGVAYKCNKDPRKDSVVFVSGGKMLAIPVASINETFKVAGVNRKIQRPVAGDDDKAIMDNFHSLKIGEGVFKGDKFAVESLKETNKKPDIDPSGFNLARYNRGLEKYTNGVTGVSAKESAENKKAFEDFWTTWVKSPDQVERVVFNVNPKTGKRIDSVTLVTKDGEEFTVSSWILRAALTLGRSDVNGNEGFKFTGGQGSVAYIDSVTPSEMAKNILLKTNVNGVKLPESVEVIVGKPQ